MRGNVYVSQPEQVVNWVPEILLTAEVAFRGLNRCMPQQELNLLDLAAVAVAQLRTSPPQVMRCNVLQSSFFATGLDHVPHNILRDAFPRSSYVMRTVALRWIFTRRRVCRTSGWHRANWFGWCSTREKHWPNWTKLDHDANCQFLASA
jgi:hypothetical protein